MIPDAPWITRMEEYGTLEDETPVLYCENCGEGILEGELYYEIFDTVLCERCVENKSKYAEREW